MQWLARSSRWWFSVEAKRSNESAWNNSDTSCQQPYLIASQGETAEIVVGAPYISQGRGMNNIKYIISFVLFCLWIGPEVDKKWQKKGAYDKNKNGQRVSPSSHCAKMKPIQKVQLCICEIICSQSLCSGDPVVEPRYQAPARASAVNMEGGGVYDLHCSQPPGGH